jgi:putative ABC transport system substrate-binding protein
VLIGPSENDPVWQTYVATFRNALAKLGWLEGSNLRIELRFGGGDPDRIRSHAAELVSLSPDAIVTSTGATTRAVQQQTQAIPILFVGGGDPAAVGGVRNIARPEGNITGFSAPEPSIAGKWLELLKEAVPRVSRAAIIFIPDLTGEIGTKYFSSIDAAAQRLGLRVIKMPVSDTVDIVRAIDAFAGEPDGGIVVLPPPPTPVVREAIFRLAAEHRLPAIYPSRADAVAGGLMSYARDIGDDYRRAATYADRILRGAKVSELPVQFPTKLELAINLKTAKALGLTVPPSLLARADEVIE